MSAFGIILVLFAAVVGIREKLKHQSKTLVILVELGELIDRIRIEIGCYLTPIERIIVDSDLPTMRELGFFEIAAKDGLEHAYECIEKELEISGNARYLLRRFFSMIGKGYAPDEIRLIDTTATELIEVIKHEREGEPARKKLTVTLAMACALGIIILLI